MNLKIAVVKNQVEKYMSNTTVINFIKDYESLNDEEVVNFVNKISRYVVKK